MPRAIGIIGWSHGGMIALLSVFRNPSTFRAAVAIVPGDQPVPARSPGKASSSSSR